MCKSKRYLLVVLNCLFLVSCKISIPTDNSQVVSKLPKSFGSLADSSRLKLPDWKDYFSDSILVSLIDEGLNSNFDLQEAVQRIESYRSQVVLNKGVLLPDGHIQAGAGVRKFGDYTVDGVGNYDTNFSPNLNSKQKLPNPVPDYSLGFQSSWEIDLWGKLRSRKKAAGARFLASVQGKNLVQSTLVALIANVYYDLLEQNAELKTLNENIRLQTRAVEIVNVQKQTGQVNQLAVEILEAQLLSSQEATIRVEQSIFEIENELNFLLGRLPQPISSLNDFLTLPLPEAFNSGVPSDLLVYRPDIQQAEMELKATRADLFSAKQAFFPSLTISSAFGFQAFNAGVLFEAPASIAYSVLGGLTGPLLNRRVLKSQLLSSKAEQRRAYIDYERKVTNGFIEVFNSLKNAENSDRMFSLKSQEVAILRQSIITSADLFISGRATYLEVVNAQKNALQSQLELAELKKRQFKARIDLYKSLGGGWK